MFLQLVPSFIPYCAQRWPDPGPGAEEIEMTQFVSQFSEGDKHMCTWMVGTATKPFLQSAFYKFLCVGFFCEMKSLERIRILGCHFPPCPSAPH